jgi:hypothetical protein
MRAVTCFAVVIAGAALAGAGCDWRDFDNLQADTPVLRVGPPSGYAASHDFGGVILALTPPPDGSAAARFLGAATVETGLALVDLDAHGQPSTQNVTGTALVNLDTEPLTAMAEIPGAEKVLLGSPTLTGGNLLTLDLTSLTVSPFVSSTEPQFGVGVAAGNVGGAAASDYVALSGSELHVYLDGSASSPLVATDSAACPLTFSLSLPSAERINRAVVIGALTGTGTQIAVGTPVVQGAGTGTVSFFTVDAAGTTVSCAQGLTAPGTTDIQFGRSLAVGDFDGDGIADLLVGSPPNRAYLYRGPIAAGAAPTATITNASSGGAFGATLVALNLDGKPGDEALIADPEATVGGQALAGNVLIYSGPALATKMTTVLADHDPSASEGYGLAMGALPFCATMPCPTAPPRLPLVGASSLIFTYFTLGPTDPRK